LLDHCQPSADAEGRIFSVRLIEAAVIHSMTPKVKPPALPLKDIKMISGIVDFLPHTSATRQ
jgi:hypothetical protein